MSGLPKALQRPERFRSGVTPPYHPTFIEKLLLAIIDAHPPSKNLARHEQLQERETRLRTALKALLGYSVKGRPENFDLALLVETWLEVINQRAFHNVIREAFPAPDARTILRDNTQTRRGEHEYPSTLGVLADKYKDYTPYFEAAIGFHSPGIPEEDEIFSDLDKIRRIFERYDIGLVLDCIDLGLVSVRDSDLRRRMSVATE